MTKIIIDGVDVSECRFYNYGEGYNSDTEEFFEGACECITAHNEYGEFEYFGVCKGSDCYYKQLKRKEQECEKLRFPMKDTNYALLTKEEFEQLDQLKSENEELTRYKSLFEKTRNLWNEARIHSYKLLDEIKDLKDSLKRTICQSECYKHKEAEKLKQALLEIKEIANKNEVCPYHISHHCYKYDCKSKEHCEIAQILQKCEVLD